MVVADITPDGVAAKAGIRRGDIILSFDRTDVNSTEQLAKLVKESPAGQPIAVLIKRQAATQFLALTLPEA